MDKVKQRQKAKDFAQKWLKREGYEKGQAQKFWVDLLRDVFGEESATDKILFEERVQLEHKSVNGYVN